MGGFAFILGNDPTYFKIEGKWLNDEPYGTIHRLVSSPGNNGFADRCFKFCIDVVGNVRVDTHRDNTPMKKAILRNGFQYCGIIYLANGAPRDAFHFDPEKVK